MTKFAKGPVGWESIVADLRSFTTGDNIGDFVGAYFQRAVDESSYSEENKAGMKIAIEAFSDAIEQACPMGLMPTARGVAMMYGPRIEPNSVMIAAAFSSGKSLFCSIPVDALPGDDWPLLAEFKEKDIPAGPLWGILSECVEDNDHPYDALVNTYCLRMGATAPNALSAQKRACRAILKSGFVPLLGVVCHRNEAKKLTLAAALTLILPPSLGTQAETAQALHERPEGPLQ